MSNDKRIDELISRFENSDLLELEVELKSEEGFRLNLKRGVLSPAAGPGPSASSPPPPLQTPSPQKGESPAKEDSEVITSPIVGTFYRAPGPDSPPFAEVGKQLSAGETICIIEAMKILNKLEVEYDCEVVDILAENGRMVEFGTPLFEVKRK